MDDYIKKPITERELTRAFGRALAHLAGRGMSPVNATVPVVEPSVPQGLSEAELLATLDEEPVAASVEDPHGFSPETRQHLQELFWQHAPQRMATLRETFDSGDLSAMLRVRYTYVQRYLVATIVDNLLTISPWV